MNDQQLARGLGWFSIGLGIAQIVAPRSVARFIGVRSHGIMPALGAREIASGIAILTRERPAGGIWSRVGGDAMDLSLLSREMGADNPDRGKVMATTAAVAGVTVLDLYCARQVNAGGERGQYNGNGNGNGVGQYPRHGKSEIRKAISIHKSPEELYAFWRNFENLPRIMPQLDSVESLGANRTRWRAKAPMGKTLEWEAETTEDRPNELIAWRSIEGSEMKTTGQVRFTPQPGDRGTSVQVAMTYELPGGILGKMGAYLAGDNPERQVYDALRAFKQIVELGELTLSEGIKIEERITQKPARAEAIPAAAKGQG